MTTSIGPAIFVFIILFLLFSLQFPVSPWARCRIKVPAAQLWRLLSPYDGKVDNWGNTVITTHLISDEDQIYGISYQTTQSNGTVRKFDARFKVTESVENKLVVLKRDGLAAKATKNELLEIRHTLEPLGPDGAETRLTTTYIWGKRPFLAQLLARTDMWGGIYRLKGLAETGKPDNRAYWIINGLVALFTGLLSVMSFALFLGWIVGVFLIICLAVHEFGHLLAFRLMGQPWGRIIFLPFMGAVAVPRLPYESQSQAIFAALMGPGFSLFLAIGCIFPIWLEWKYALIFAGVGMMTAIINAFNMIPAEPLDGGMAMRSILTRLVGHKAWSALVALGLLVIGAGISSGQFVYVLFGAVAILANLWRRKIDIGLEPLSKLQTSLALFFYVFIAGAHLTMMSWFMHQFGL